MRSRTLAARTHHYYCCYYYNYYYCCYYHYHYDYYSGLLRDGFRPPPSPFTSIHL